MDKSAIIEFSNTVREKLNAEVQSRAANYGIFPKEIHAVEEHADSVVINGIVFNSRIKNQRSQLVKQIKEKGYVQFMEEVTYTWFKTHKQDSRQFIGGRNASTSQMSSDIDSAQLFKLLKHIYTNQTPRRFLNRG